MKAFDDTHEGSLDYRKFCELVMGSTKATVRCRKRLECALLHVISAGPIVQT